MRHSSIVLLSGGLDSLASFHWASVNTDLMFALTFDYGQLAAKNEIEAAARICRLYDVKQIVIPLPWYSSLKASPLMDGSLLLPQVNRAELDDLAVTRQSAAAVWIPNRNGVFINIAAAFAESRLADEIIVGFNREEAATFPDNSPEFGSAANGFLKYSTNGKVGLTAPMQEKNKAEIVQWMLEEEVDLSPLWSCYRGGEKGKMCGRCESCARLQRALDESGASRWMEKLF